MNPVHFSSASDEWATPRDLAAKLVAEFKLTLDVCASPGNAVVPNFFTKEQDGLARNWNTPNVWMNPPYGRGIGAWVAKAARHAKAGVAVCLLPARTDTRWWHDHIWDFEKHAPRPGVEVRFLPGRLKFGGSANSAPFPSCVVIFR
jgi:site-specific DNA-methyltransferase (adenine-specific)